MKPTREQRIFIQTNDSKGYQVSDRDGNTLLKSDDKYFIYFKNVNFKKDGKMEGTFLGDNPQSLIDGYCRGVAYRNDGWIQEDGATVRSARMVAINNQNGAIIIIQSN